MQHGQRGRWLSSGSMHARHKRESPAYITGTSTTGIRTVCTFVRNQYEPRPRPVSPARSCWPGIRIILFFPKQSTLNNFASMSGNSHTKSSLTKAARLALLSSAMLVGQPRICHGSYCQEFRWRSVGRPTQPWRDIWA
jgi:hypothetical protein